jgi:hypothetical protein
MRTIGALCAGATAFLMVGLSAQITEAQGNQARLRRCVCNALQANFRPVKTQAGRTHFQSGPSTAAAARRFERAVRRCLSRAGQSTMDDLFDWPNTNIKIRIVATNSANQPAEAGPSSADIVIAIAGNGATTSTETGGSATATASAGGATIAIGGRGGNNDNNASDGGSATATSAMGGDSVAIGGDGGSGAASAGNGGASEASSVNGDDNSTATASGGCGGENGNDDANGPCGGMAKATSDIGSAEAPGGGKAIETVGPGQHGEGAIANSGPGSAPGRSITPSVQSTAGGVVNN